MSSKCAGVPETLNLTVAEEWVRGRISKKRFEHVRGVVAVAAVLATKHGCDVYQAQLASWLHDCCKEVKDSALIVMADEMGIETDEHTRARGHLLHGPVAAAVVARDFGITNRDLLDAIAEHTMGNAPMCPLSEVVYMADCLEEGRSADYRATIWQNLEKDGVFNMAAGLVAAMNLCIQDLIETKRPIHPKTVHVRNYYLSRML